MESVTITIHWHDESQPIYLVAFQPAVGVLPRLVTAGGDSNVRIWRLSPLISGGVEYLSTLRKHTQAVNAVRFDSSGTTLASAGDDGSLILWKRSDTIKREFGEEEDDDDASELWIAKKILRNSTSEIYDISWSPDGDHIAAGAMDNSLRIYNLATGKTAMIRDHAHYVQGVAWDPLGEFLVTQLADRSINVYRFQNKLEEPVLLHKSSRGVFENDRLRVLYHSETLQSFFRRLTFSPDGSLLLVPLGVYRAANEEEKGTKGGKEQKTGNSEDSENSGYSENNPVQKIEKSDTKSNSKPDQQEENAVYIYTRSNLKNPICVLSGFSKPAVVVAFSPITYETKSSAVFDLPYRMVFAVATQDLIVVYSTDSLQPLGYTLNLHYLTITDILWNTDGQSLVASSTDGFCSLVTFKEGIFGHQISLKKYQKLQDRENEENFPNGVNKSRDEQSANQNGDNNINFCQDSENKTKNGIDSMLQTGNKMPNSESDHDKNGNILMVDISSTEDTEIESYVEVVDRGEKKDRDLEAEKDVEMYDNNTDTVQISKLNKAVGNEVVEAPAITLKIAPPAKIKKRVQPTLVNLTTPGSDF